MMVGGRTISGLAAGIALSLALAASADAATIKVTKTGDSGRGSLRKAIQRAEAGDTVRAPEGHYRLRQGQLVVDEAIAIRGAGARRTVVDGRGRSRVFEIVHPTGRVKIGRLEVTGGREEFGAGIRAEGDLVVNRALIDRNRAAGGDFAMFGAGITMLGAVLVVKSSRITRNTVADTDMQSFGPGISSVVDQEEVRIVRSTISRNRIGPGGRGAAVFYSAIPDAGGADLTLERSTVSGNTGGRGAALAYQVTDNDGFAHQLRISGSTISGNTVPGSGNAIGGGLHVSAVGTDAASVIATEITNSTISGNVAGSPGTSGFGGGAFLETVSINGASTPVEMRNATITRNRAVDGEGGGVTNGVSSADPVFVNSIVAGNAAPVGPDCSGPFVSAGNNLERGTSCGFTELGDLQGTMPRLEPLRRNGGPTATHALKRASEAINAGANATCEERDQRGVRRPQGPRCDIGAFERKRREG
jgi:hypothetical protein